MKIFTRVIPVLLSLIFLQDVSAQITVVSGGAGLAGSYTSLTNAGGLFAALNGTSQTGQTIVISITGDVTTEAGTNALTGALGMWTSLTISPSGARTISGAATAGSPLIDFSGADNVTINGLNSGGNTLVISNTTVSATSGTSTIRFIGGATNNTITNCNVQGAGTMSVATNGATIFFSTDAVTANGNDNNTISNCDLGPVGANLPTKAILGNGSTTTTAIGNSGITITNNDIHDYFGAAVTSSGIATNGGCNTWTITNNRFYQTGTRTWTTGAVHRAIDINGSTATSGAVGFTVTGNIIGYASNTQTGTYTLTGSNGKFQGIQFTGISTGTISNINSNTIASVSLAGVTSSGTSTSSPFMGIFVNNGLVNTNSNTIGSQSTTGSLVFSTNSTTTTDVIGIYNFSADVWTSNSNNIGGISATNAAASGTYIIYGLRANTGTTVTWTANSNIIGGTIANSIQLASTGTSSQVIGMHTSNAPASLTSNIVRNLANNNGTGTTTAASVIGINVTTSTPNHTLSQNIISNLTNSHATAATTVTGIQFTGGTSNVVERNFIYGLTTSTTSTSAEVNGIRVSGGTTTYRNNIIAIGAGISNAIGTGSTAGINGINEPLGTDNFYHNSVYIDGAPTAGVGPSFAFNSSQTVSTRVFRDNVFFNARSNSGATGKHYAVRVGGTTANPTGLTINNNVYFANGTGAVFGFFNSLDVANLAAWKTAVGQDAGSFESNPRFLDPTNALPDLHINPSIITAVEGNGVDVGVTLDYDGQTRSGLTPVDIGADAGNFMGADLTAPVITYTALANTTSTSNRTTSSFATITDASGVNVTAGTAPRIYYKKSTDTNTFNDNTSATAGWKYAESTTGSSPFDFTINYALLNSAPVVTGDVIQYFVVAQDLGVPTVAINSGTFTVIPTSVALTAAAFPIGGTINSYTITAAIGGTKTVCPSGCDYATLTVAAGAFSAINAATVTSNITLEIAGDLTVETGAILLNEFASPYTVTIKPTGSAKLITGTSASGLITLNGADRVTIDGSLGSTPNTVCPASAASRDLTITNTNTGTSSAVVWMQTTAGSNAATNNTVKNCNIVGNSNTTTLIGVGSGSTTISISTLGTGNINNRIENNNISKTQYGIVSQGASAANKNTGTVINQNLINTVTPNNVQIGGIYVGFDNGAVISGNNIAGMVSSTDAFGISTGVTSWVATTSTGNEVSGATISNNTIGLVQNTGANSAAGILVGPSATGTNRVSNNMAYGVISNSTPGDITAGIFAICGVGATQVYYNTVSMTGDRGSGTTGSSLALAVAGTDPTIDIRNNILINKQTTASTGKSYAIGLGYSTFANLTSNNNDLFTSGANSAFGVTSALNSGTDRTTLALWQAATTKDAASVNIDAIFSSATDLHLNYGLTSTQLESGGAVVSVVADIDCQARPGPTGSVNGGGTTPDIGADEFDGVPPATMIYVSSTTDQITGGVFAGAVNQQIIRVKVVTSGSVSPLSLTSLDLNANGTTAITDINATPARVYYTGASTTFSTATLFGSATPTIATFTVTGTQTLGTGDNYFWLAYDVIPGATSGNLVDAECTSLTVGTSRTPTVTAPAGNRVIVGAMCGNYNVGSAQTFPNFATLTAAIADLNVRGVSCAVTFTLLDASYSIGTGETFPLTINAVTGASATNTITIKPATGVNSAIAGTSTGAIIKLNGADYVTIDGSNNGSTSKNLTISNASTGTSSAVIWLASATASNGATNNTIKNSIITGNASTTTLMGVFSGGTASISTTGNALIANTSNTIQNNTISKAQNGIFVIGTSTGSLDNSLSVTNNTLGSSTLGDGFSVSGITIQLQNNAIISGNDVQNLTNTGSAGLIDVASNTINVGVYTRNSTNTAIYNNSIHNINIGGSSIIRSYALSLESPSFNTISTPSNTLVYNNFIFDTRYSGTGSSVWQHSAINDNGGYGDKFYFNSVNLTGAFTATSGPSAAFSNGNAANPTAASNIDVRNNIFNINISTAGTTSVFYAHHTTATTYTGSTINNNDLVSITSGSATALIGRFNAVNYATIALWQAGTSQDVNSFTEAPIFTSPTNLHINTGLTSTRLESGGVTVSVTTDIDGDVRPGPTGSVNGGGTLPDVGADEFDGVPPTPMTYVSSTTEQITGGTYAGSVNQQIIRVKVVTSGSISPLSLTSLDLNANGTTAITDINATAAKVYYTGSSTTFSTGTLFGSATPTIATFTVTGTQTLGTGDNYFWLAYDIIPGAASGNVIDGEATSLTVGTVRTPTVTAPAGNRVIVGAMCGNYNVGTGQTFPNFATLTAAIADLDIRGVSCAVTFSLLDASYSTGETFPLIINAVAGTSATNTITIKPATGITTTITAATATDIIDLAGSDYVTIDGSNNGTTSQNLTLSSTNTASGIAVLSIESLGNGLGATNNTIKNCIIQGGTKGNSTILNFGIFVGNNNGTAAGPDNDNLTIRNNIIRKVNIGIQVVGGTSPNQNDNLLIAQNFIGDTIVPANYIGGIGLLVSQATASEVSDNTIRNVETSETLTTTLNNATGIVISTGFINSIVTRNTITGIRYTGTTGYGGKGIDISTGNTVSNLTISNNMVSDIKGDGWSSLSSDAIIGIRIGGTTGGLNLYFNTVNLGSGIFAGSTSGTQSAALYIASTVVTTGSLNIRNNIFRTNLQNSNATAKTWAINSATVNTVFADINYNDYVVGGTQGVLGYLTSDRLTLADIVTGFGGNANSVNINPVFVTANNPHLVPISNFALNNLGTTIAGITLDLDIDTRSVTVPDMGADEFEPTVTLNLTAFIEGYMNGATMRPVLINSGIGGALATDCDTITVELHSITTPYGLIQSYKGVLQTNGTLTCTFPGEAFGKRYYIVLKHRNGIETWSSTTPIFPAVSSYDFSTAATKAYASNMVQVGSVWTIYSGDIDPVKDGFVDFFDYAVWETDYFNFAFGYFISDLNGDGAVDFFDYPIWEQNYFNFVSVAKP